MNNRPKILFVDDDKDLEFIIRQKFRDKTAEGEWEIDFAYEGKSALKKIAEDPRIEMVITDINMPVMDGLTLLKKINELEDRLIYTLVVSAYDDMNNIRKAMNYGAYDFITKPIDFGDMEITIQKCLDDLSAAKLGVEAQEKLKHTILEKEKAEQSEQIKKDFFANLTHEFRTPLTLIMGPLELLMERSKSEEARRLLQISLRNSKQLLGLINELLDISKVESGLMKLNLLHDDFIQFSRELASSFSSFAEQKGISFEFEASPEKLEMDFDHDKMAKILNNLFSNAIKFTKEDGKISASIKGDKKAETLSLKIKDSGVGVPEDQLESIFDRYYQAENSQASRIKGTGIGLSLTKELIELHGGTITVSSIENLGTEFLVVLPMNADAPLTVADNRPNVTTVSDIDEIEEESENGIDDTPDLETLLDDENDSVNVLIIEDNNDVRGYIKMSLNKDYQSWEAVDGIKGVEKAKELVPDIIVSDVMMPGMDGYEVCKIIKEDLTTSHIPVILLTAKSSTDSRIEGIEQGADAYITKPFNPRELNSQISNLIAGRKILRERYKREFLTSPGEVKSVSMEEEFLQRVRAVMENHLDDDQFGVEAMCDELGMSRTQLHRKLKALTGVSTSHYIRNYRLNFAMQLLKNNAGTVAEIAYKSGFGSPSYFTKCFTEQYDISPKDVKKQ